MVRAVSAFECEWCGKAFSFIDEAQWHEGECIKGVNRAELMGKLEDHIEQQPHEPLGTSTMLATDFALRRLALYDRLAKEHGIEQEKTDGDK